jgi:hypothetical protein
MSCYEEDPAERQIDQEEYEQYEQDQLALWIAQQDRWDRLTDKERESEIKEAMRLAE